MEIEKSVEQKIACVCDSQAELDGEIMIQCEQCNNWLHCSCVGLSASPELLPTDYFCAKCRPPVKSLDKSDSAKDLLQQQVEESYQILSLQELNELSEKLSNGYLFPCKRPDPKMKMESIVERVLEMEKYLEQADTALVDDHTFKEYADNLLLEVKKHSDNEKDVEFVETGHTLFCKLIAHNAEKYIDLRRSIATMKAEHPSYFG